MMQSKPSQGPSSAQWMRTDPGRTSLGVTDAGECATDGRKTGAPPDAVCDHRYGIGTRRMLAKARFGGAVISPRGAADAGAGPASAWIGRPVRCSQRPVAFRRTMPEARHCLFL